MSTRIRKAKPAATTTPQTSSKKRPLLLAGGVAAVGVAAVMAFWWNSQSAPQVPPQASGPESRPAATQDQAALPQQPRPAEPETLFTKAMPTDKDTAEPAPQVEQAQSEANAAPFQIDQIVYALSEVSVDENGDVVIDEAAQTILEQAFLDPDTQVDEQQLSELKAMIEAGLDGKAGSQAAAIADKFYRYSTAFREVSDTLAVRTDLQSIRNDHEQIARLRRTHLGKELAEQLYAREEALTEYTLEVIELQGDQSLTPEQRKERQQALAERYPEIAPAVGKDTDTQSAQPSS